MASAGVGSERSRVGVVGLFGDAPLTAFDEGVAGDLVTRRNRAIGNLLLAERAVFYVQILYRMLLFRRSHELEPLYDDIHNGVRDAQESRSATGDYGLEQFRADMNQLEDWELVSYHIEIERLRGYRDTRRRKFRYTLTGEALAFLEWLEQRAQAEFDRPDDDARDLLEEVSGVLHDLFRYLDRFGTDRQEEEDARRVLYRLFRLDDLTLSVNTHLGDFNARLLTFVVRRYDVAAAKQVLRDLEDFVNHFLRQIHALRGSIVQDLGQLLQTPNLQKIRTAGDLLASERQRTPQVMRALRDPQVPQRIPFLLNEFYRENGRLDGLSQRIHDAALKVWRKLHAHLRELERRSTRVEDLRARIEEMAALPETTVPHGFMRELILSAAIRGDPNYWDGYEDADPPQPRYHSRSRRPPVKRSLKRKERGARAVVSMEQARMERLRDWMQEALGQVSVSDGRSLSNGAFTELEDFEKLMEVSKAGVLGRGRKLRRVQFRLEPDPSQRGVVEIEPCRLEFNELMVYRSDEAGRTTTEDSGDE